MVAVPPEAQSGPNQSSPIDRLVSTGLVLASELTHVPVFDIEHMADTNGRFEELIRIAVRKKLSS